MDDLTPPEAAPKKDAAKIFDKPLSEGVRDKKPQDDIMDLDPDNDNDTDDDVLLETSFCQPDALPPECPFSFLYLSSEDSSRDEALDDLNDLNSLPDVSKKQGTSHIPVTSEQVLQSDGEERFKWMCAGRKELDNLQGTKTVEPISPDAKEKIKAAAKAAGKKYIELPSKGVFTIKPDKYKVRIGACGNKTHETYGRTSTTDLDTAMMRYLVSWGASSPDFTIASLDVTAAFLNAPLPEGRVVVLKPPSILYKLQLMLPGHVWLVRLA